MQLDATSTLFATGKEERAETRASRPRATLDLSPVATVILLINNRANDSTSVTRSRSCVESSERYRAMSNKAEK